MTGNKKQASKREAEPLVIQRLQPPTSQLNNALEEQGEQDGLTQHTVLQQIHKPLARLVKREQAGGYSQRAKREAQNTVLSHTMDGITEEARQLLLPLEKKTI